MKHFKAYLDTKEKVKGVHILVGGFMNPVFCPLFNILDAQNNVIKYWSEGTEPWGPPTRMRSSTRLQWLPIRKLWAFRSVSSLEQLLYVAHDQLLKLL